MKLRGKTAIVTGGAKGIGLQTVKKFLEEGANVVLLDLNREDIVEAFESLETSSKLKTFIGDVTNKDDIQQLVSFTKEHFGRIDILVNNAGITADAQLLKMEEEAWDQVIDVNLKGVFLVTQAVAKEMKEQASGVILNASSIVGRFGNFGQTNYAASKFGVIGLTKTWARELGRFNIRVNAVAPGFILTDMTKKMPEKVLNSMKEKSVLKQLGEPEDIANAYAFLASDEAKYITGTVLNVDGGTVI